MALGDGCWAPGIHWDAENSAAFTGPRAGSWPYAGCPIGTYNGLTIDSPAGRLLVDPPMQQYPYAQTWNETGSGNTPAAGYLIQPGASVNVLAGGANPSISVPAPTCGSMLEMDWGSFMFDVTVGTGATFGALSYAAGGNLYQINNPAPTAPTQAADSIGTRNLTFANASAPTWYDEPWANASTGLNSVYGSALLNGTNQGFVNTPFGFNAAGDWTLSMWVKVASTPASGTWHTFFSLGSSSWSNLWLSYGYGGGSNFYYQVFSAPTSGAANARGLYTAPVSAQGQWHHLVFQHLSASNQFALYFDGSLVLGPSSVVDTIWVNQTTDSLRFGCRTASSALTEFLNAQYSSLMLYTSALTAAQITQLYNTPAAPPSGAASWWKLQDGSARRRVRRTYTYSPGFFTPATTYQAAYDMNLSSSNGNNPSVINNWQLGITGVGYAPNVG